MSQSALVRSRLLRSLGILALAGVVAVVAITVVSAEERPVVGRNLALTEEELDAAKANVLKLCSPRKGEERVACLDQSMPDSTTRISKVVGTETTYDFAAAWRMLLVEFGVVVLLLGLVLVWTRSSSSATRQSPRDGGHRELGDQLRALAALRDEGLLSEEEYQTRRSHVLGRYP